MIPKPYLGKWRITHMDQWDQDFVDLVEPGNFKIGKDGTGSFRFGAVQGEMDCRVRMAGDDEVLEFSWDGSDEYDPASGRGWIMVKGARMEGHFYFHQGDDSKFTAERMK